VPADAVRSVKIEVFDNQIEAALKTLKKQMLKDGVFQEMKRRAHYEETLGQAEAQVGHGAQAAAARAEALEALERRLRRRGRAAAYGRRSASRRDRPAELA